MPSEILSCSDSLTLQDISQTKPLAALPKGACATELPPGRGITFAWEGEKQGPCSHLSPVGDRHGLLLGGGRVPPEGEPPGILAK